MAGPAAGKGRIVWTGATAVKVYFANAATHRVTRARRVVSRSVYCGHPEALAGGNTEAANAVAVEFSVFIDFPTLVEVPVARMFLDLGMHPGPLLAYLMADPELSRQSILMISAIIGRTKTAAAKRRRPGTR